MTAALALYRAATALLEPLAPVLLSRRAAKGKEDRARLGERLGRAGVARPDGPLVWLHGSSVGETLSLLPLLGRMSVNRTKELEQGVMMLVKLRRGTGAPVEKNTAAEPLAEVGEQG